MFRSKKQVGISSSTHWSDSTRPNFVRNVSEWWEEIRRKEIWLVATQINGWFIMENPIKIGWFGGNPIFGNTLFWIFIQYLGKWSNLTCIFFRWVAKKPPTRNFRILLEKIYSVKATLGYFFAAKIALVVHILCMTERKSKVVSSCQVDMYDYCVHIYIYIYISGQIIATSHDLTPKGS